MLIVWFGWTRLRRWTCCCILCWLLFCFVYCRYYNFWTGCNVEVFFIKMCFSCFCFRFLHLYRLNYSGKGSIWLFFKQISSFYECNILCDFDFHDFLFFFPNFTLVWSWGVIHSTVDTFSRVFTFAGQVVIVSSSTVFTYWPKIFWAVIFMVVKFLAVKTQQRIGYIDIYWYESVEYPHKDFGTVILLKVRSRVFVSIVLFPFLIVKRFTAITPWSFKYSLMFSSVSPFKALSLIIPLVEFRVWCSETVTGRLKKVFIFRRFSVCVFLDVSTNRVWFLSFFTDFGVPIVDSICFSITNGDKEVIGFSVSFDFTTRNLAKLSTGLKTVEMLFS